LVTEEPEKLMTEEQQPGENTNQLEEGDSYKDSEPDVKKDEDGGNNEEDINKEQMEENKPEADD